LEHEVDRLLVGGGVLEKRRDVVEEDARLREIGDLANLGAKLLSGHRWSASPWSVRGAVWAAARERSLPQGWLASTVRVGLQAPGNRGAEQHHGEADGERDRQALVQAAIAAQYRGHDGSADTGPK